MRIPAYLVRSRHGIFYFRWPIPPALHPRKQRSQIKLSLATRDPAQALPIARYLCYLGEELARKGNLNGMRYDEIRAVLLKHFSKLLQQKKAQIAADGPLDNNDIGLTTISARIAQQAIDEGTAIDLTGNDDALLARFAGMYNLPLSPSSPLYSQFRRDFAAAYRDYCQATLDYNASMSKFDFSPPPTLSVGEIQAINVADVPTTTLREAGEKFVAESWKAEKWTSKTKGEREDHLKLLYEILGADTHIATVTKHQARIVKGQLLKLPKNRNKRQATRGLTLEEAISRAEGETIGTTTVNKYLQTYSGLFIWAERNGYSKSNLFSGLALIKGKRASRDRERLPFNEAQMNLILEELISNTNGLIGDKKPWRKWAPLIAAFTGASLNEIAQLELRDIQSNEGIDFFDVNDEGEQKSVKARASKRRVPIHSTLKELGLMEYVESMRSQHAQRLFPEFSYCAKNGWGRNLSHWFNQVFLVNLGIKTNQLVFHSFRHSAVDRLNKRDAPNPLIQCVVGHEQAGVTQQVYGRSGFTLKQLQDTVELLDYKAAARSA